MERNYEDKLMELAFGELNPEEATRLEARLEADPLAARDVAFTRLMREDLLSLADNVPPDQLSKERLRQAILGNGLHPVPMRRSLGLGWLWAPAAAFAAAFVFVFLRNQPAEPTFVQDTGKSRPRVALGGAAPRNPEALVGGRAISRENLQTLGLENFSTGSAALSGMNLDEERPVAPAPVEARGEIVTTAGAAQKITESTKEESLADEERALVQPRRLDTLVNSPAEERGYAADGITAVQPRDGSSADSTIVLIRPDQNGTTGAQTAKELEKENVLVGG